MTGHSDRDHVGAMRTPFSCKFCHQPINFVQRVALNPDGSKHLCRNAIQDTEEVDYRDDIARIVLQAELARLTTGEGLNPCIPDYCYEVADLMLAARRNLRPQR